MAIHLCGFHTRQNSAQLGTKKSISFCYTLMVVLVVLFAYGMTHTKHTEKSMLVTINWPSYYSGV